MNKHERQLGDMLDTAGAEMIRQTHHRIYRLPNGRNFVLPCTPSDSNWARHSLSDLRRLVNQPLNLAARHSEPISTESMNATPAKRVRVPNRPAQQDAGVIIPPVGSSRPDLVQQPKRTVTFSCMGELLDVVYKSTSFWGLNQCGRARVLVKFAAHFAHAEAVSVRFCPITREEIKLPEGEIELPEAKKQLLMDKMNFLWDGKYSTAIRVQDPVDGDLLIETISMRFLQGFEQFYVVEADFEDSFALNIRPVWNAENGMISSRQLQEIPPDRYILYVFIDSVECNTKALPYLSSPCWTDPRYTRSATREILDLQRLLLVGGIPPSGVAH